MPFVVETGAGLPDATSYATVEEATTYHEQQGTSASWLDAAGSATIEFYNQPTDGQTITIGGTNVYTFKAVLGSNGHVKIGTNLDETVRNLVAAINNTGQSGVWYQSAASDTLVSATYSGTTVTIKAKVGGASNSSITVTSTLTLPNRPTTGALVGGKDSIKTALMAATAYIDAEYGGRWVERPVSQTQALDWPRAYVTDSGGFPVPADIVPKVVKDACAYLALLYLQGEVLMPDQSAAERSVTATSIKVGPIAKSTQYGSSGKTSQKKFRVVDSLLSEFVVSSGRIYLGGG